MTSSGLRNCSCINSRDRSASTVSWTRAAAPSTWNFRARCTRLRTWPVLCKQSAQTPTETPSSRFVTRRETLVTGIAPAGLCLALSCSQKRSALYDKYFAYSLSHLNAEYRTWIIPNKEELFMNLSSDQPIEILEMGVGTGTNFDLYKTQAPKARVTGLDPNPEMRVYAEEAAAQSSLEEFRFVQAYAGEMPFPDHAFDFVICTLVLCCIPDVAGALVEVSRVLKPKGQFLFLEHVAGPPGTATRLLQNLFDPLQQVVADGCHLTRDTLASIRAGPFQSVTAKEFSVPQALFLAPHIIGSATVA